MRRPKSRATKTVWTFLTRRRRGLSGGLDWDGKLRVGDTDPSEICSVVKSMDGGREKGVGIKDDSHITEVATGTLSGSRSGDPASESIITFGEQRFREP